MKKSMGWLAVAIVSGTALVGCAGSGKGHESVATGTIALPLVTDGASGVSYRLRGASFTISPYYYYYGMGVAGAAGAGNRAPIIVSSESNLNASTIDVEVESGSYNIGLASGWRMEKVEAGVATPVEAQLLSAQTQWLSVGAHSTSWVQYQFGIGTRAVWFNGEVNIDMTVHENPDQYYGGGAAGYPSW